MGSWIQDGFHGIAVQPSMLHMCKPCAAIYNPHAAIYNLLATTCNLWSRIRPSEQPYATPMPYAARCATIYNPCATICNPRGSHILSYRALIQTPMQPFATPLQPYAVTEQSQSQPMLPTHPNQHQTASQPNRNQKILDFGFFGCFSGLVKGISLVPKF